MQEIIGITWEGEESPAEETPRRRAGRGRASRNLLPWPRMAPVGRISRAPAAAAEPAAQPPTSREDEENLPNPELFPFLSRHLLSADSSSDGSHQAATSDAGEQAPLVIVQEPRPESPLTGRPEKRPRADGHDYGPWEHEGGAGDAGHDPRLVVIRRCPEEEHTYALNPGCETARRRPASDEDEAFSDDSDLSQEHSGRRAGRHRPAEEAGVRFIEEGADLLLNLAGVPVPAARASVSAARASMSAARASSGPAPTRRGSGRPPARGRGLVRL